MPLYGTWTILIPVSCIISSPARCTGVPIPEEPNFTASGRARAYSISPASVFAGNAGLAITTIGAVPHHHRLAPALGELLREKPRDDVGPAPGREADHHSNRLRGKTWAAGLGAAGRGPDRERRARKQGGEISHGQFLPGSRGYSI